MILPYTLLLQPRLLEVKDKEELGSLTQTVSKL